MLLAQLNGGGQPVHDLVSPPLGHEEPDRVHVLSNIFLYIAQCDGPEAVRYFRRTVVEQLIQVLIADTAEHSVLKDRQDGLERLLAYCQVMDDPELAEHLRLTLWGILTTRLEEPLPDILSLSDESRRRAYTAFDLWLSITPPNAVTPTQQGGRCLPYVQLIKDAFI